MAGLLPRRRRIEELRERYGFRTVDELTLDELFELKRSVVRNVHGKVIGYVLKIVADKKLMRAEKVVIKLLRDEGEGVLARERIIEVSPRNVLLVKGYIFVVRSLDEGTINRIMKIGLANIVTENNLVGLASKDLEVGVRAAPGKIAEEISTRHKTVEAQPELKPVPAAKDVLLDEKKRIIEETAVLREKYELLRNSLKSLTEKWFKGFVSLDDYLSQSEKIRRELDEVKRLLAGALGGFEERSFREH